MFEFEGFGKRLQTLRKQRGLTQEDMADRVGVSPQAVSKWENDQSYPDITLIPTVATILGTDINYLFGKKEEEITMENTFPNEYEGLALVHSTNAVACYSNKTVERKDATGVRFTDGSTAELSSRMAMNAGPGDIRFLGAKEAKDVPHETVDRSIVSNEYVFPYVKNVDIAVLDNHCEILRSGDENTRVLAKGDKRFMSRLQVQAINETLKIFFINEQGNRGNINNNDRGNRHDHNEITVYLPCETGGLADISVVGTGSLTSRIERFENGCLSVVGSGDITMGGFDGKCEVSIVGSGDVTAKSATELGISIVGSGDVHWESAEDVKVTINGSGDVNLGTATSLAIYINGSGDVNVGELNGGGNLLARITSSCGIRIGGGSCEKFDADTFSSGNIHAEGLTVRKAHIIVHNNGNVVLGRVLESSTEQIKKNGEIRILKRGSGENEKGAITLPPN
jgi:transcriptional regulator with XRE-family HTH domain